MSRYQHSILYIVAIYNAYNYQQLNIIIIIIYVCLNIHLFDVCTCKYNFKCMCLYTVAAVIHEIPSNATILQPMSASFTCTATGSPIPLIHWVFSPFIGGPPQVLESSTKYSITTTTQEAVISRSSVLTVNSALSADAGLYTCRITSGTQTASSTATLIVQGNLLN